MKGGPTPLYSIQRRRLFLADRNAIKSIVKRDKDAVEGKSILLFSGTNGFVS